MLTLQERSSQEVEQSEVGAGPTHKFITSNPQAGGGGGGEGGIVPSLTYDFAYVCLKNAESLLPKVRYSFCFYFSQIECLFSLAEVNFLFVLLLSFSLSFECKGK